MTIRKKVICLVIPSLQPGGMERVMAELANYFTRKEVVIHLILYGIKRDIFYPISSEILVHRPLFAFNNNRRLISTLKTMFYLRSKIKKIHPDTILSFGEYWNSLVLLSLVGLRYPVFVSDRSQPNKSLGKYQDTLRNWLYPRAKGVIAQTEKARIIYSSFYPHSNRVVIGNPIRKIVEKKSLERENIVLSVGRLIRTKNHDKLIDLFLKIDLPGWKLIIVGYDHLKQANESRLREMIKERNAGEKVFLAGKQVEVDEYYLKSKVFAFTSESEGFPNVIGEAMSAGLAVVAFDCVAGPSEMIRDAKNGFLVPIGDYDKFQSQLELLMKEETLRERLAQQGREDIKKFSSEAIAQKFYEVIMDTQ